ncbi:hypothetical protein RQP54_16835 [Curvibacter sp. APW13]|uniref:hypothetical protein n=1 Tax=Curvibacter sp. APW13 TaxID=3077236 RepID=UPI0028DD440B|nr:hypothetical protein [Curvibacter sp. APW13]MDT8992539.1 hypothetical protein [Curvibacter sp. APW13]
MQSRTIGFAASRLALALSLAFAGFGAWAQAPKAEDHTAHHPADAASAPKPAPKAAAPKPAAKPASAPAQPAAMDKSSMDRMEQMDAKMKAMQEMREKFMAAKTPEERMALMPEHMKTMQDAMAMMAEMRAGSAADKGGMGMMADKGHKGMMMGGGDKPSMMDKMPMDMMAKHKMMEKRMDMMESMMQMMMDRMQASAAK